MSSQATAPWPVPANTSRAGRRLGWVALIGVAVVSSAVGFYVGSLRPEPSVTLIEGSPTSLTIGWFKAPGTQSAPDASASIKGNTDVKRIASELNRLRPLPRGTRVCGFDDGSNYQLLFLYANGDRATVQVGEKGCQDVAIFGAVRATAAYTNLLSDLHRLVPGSA